jgi:hypothetical protein
MNECKDPQNMGIQEDSHLTFKEFCDVGEDSSLESISVNFFHKLLGTPESRRPSFLINQVVYLLMEEELNKDFLSQYSREELSKKLLVTAFKGLEDPGLPTLNDSDILEYIKGYDTPDKEAPLQDKLTHALIRFFPERIREEIYENYREGEDIKDAFRNFIDSIYFHPFDQSIEPTKFSTELDKVRIYYSQKYTEIMRKAAQEIKMREIEEEEYLSQRAARRVVEKIISYIIENPETDEYSEDLKRSVLIVHGKKS